MTDLKLKAAMGVKWTSLSTVITALLKFLQIAVLARLLSPEDFGLMAIVLILMGFAKLFGESGLSEAVIQRPNPTKNELSSVYWVTVSYGIFAFITFYLLSPVIAAIWDMPKLVELIPVSAIILIFGSIENQFQALLRKSIKFNEIAIADIIAVTVGTIISIASVWQYDQGVWAFVWGLISMSFTRMVIMIFHAKKNNYFPKFHLNLSEIKSYIVFGLYRIGGISTGYFNSRIDQLLIGNFMGANILGQYNLASNVTNEPASRINPVISRVALPVLSKVQNDKEKLKKGFLKILGVLTLVNVPLFLGLAAVAPIAVPLIFGEQWIKTIPLVQILSFVALNKIVGTTTDNLLVATGHVKWSFYWNTANLIVTPTVMLIATMTGDVLTVAWALVVLNITLDIILYKLILKIILGSFIKDLYKDVLPILLIGLIMYTSLAVTISIFNLNTEIFNLFMLILIGGIVYSLLIFIFRKKQLNEYIELIQRKRNLS